MIESHRSVLHVASAYSKLVDAGRAKFGVCRRAARLVKPLLFEIRLSATSGTALVSTITRDTYTKQTRATTKLRRYAILIGKQ